MFIRIVAIDPSPRDSRDDVVIYQVPEHSRAHELLIELLDSKGIEWISVEAVIKRKRKVKESSDDRG